LDYSRPDTEEIIASDALVLPEDAPLIRQTEPTAWEIMIEHRSELANIAERLT